MAQLYQRVNKRPLPVGAKVACIKGKMYATWKVKGRSRRAPLSEDGSGIISQSAIYTICYTDEHGRPKWVSSRMRDRDAAARVAAEIEDRVRLKRAGLLDPAQERHAEAARRPVAEHTAAFISFLSHLNNTPKHVRMVRRHLDAILGRARVSRLSDLRCDRVMQAIAGLQKGEPYDGQPQQPASLATCNAYLRSIKAFSLWLHRQGLASEHALAALRLYNAETDRRHVRRQMSPEELRWLFAVTAGYTLRGHQASGPVRAMCYRLASCTGYRANELKSLTTDCFDLDAAPPVVRINAGNSKRRRAETQPLPAAFVEPLRRWLAEFQPGARVFASIAGDTARMLRSDLEASRAAWLKSAETDLEQAEMEKSDFLKYEDRHGHKADFHSLRVAFVTMLSTSGADPKSLQRLARHSSPVLTMNVYNRRSVSQVASHVDAVGDLLSAQPDPWASRPAAPGSREGDWRGDWGCRAPGGTLGLLSAKVEAVGWDGGQAGDEKSSPVNAAKSGNCRRGKRKRLRSESNRRWRICNPLP
jgi:integrase